MTTATADGTQGITDIYCVKCKAKRGNIEVKRVTMKNGRPATRATCAVCGSGKYRIGGG